MTASHASVLPLLPEADLLDMRERNDAAITTAARAGWGRFRRSPGTATKMSTMAPAPTRPATCVFAPACSATAVREPLVLTGNPWNSPAATLSSADSDHLLVPVDPVAGAGRERRCRGDGVRERHEHDAERPGDEEGSRSDNATRGMVNGGNPLGSGPTTDTP